MIEVLGLGRVVQLVEKTFMGGEELGGITDGNSWYSIPFTYLTNSKK